MAVQSIERSFTLLRTIVQHPAGIGINRRSCRICLHKSMVSLLVSVLKAEQVVRGLPTACVISISSGLLVSATMSGNRFSQNLIDIAQPHLQQLADTSADKFKMIIAYSFSNSRPIQRITVQFPELVEGGAGFDKTSA